MLNFLTLDVFLALTFSTSSTVVSLAGLFVAVGITGAECLGLDWRALLEMDLDLLDD